MAVKHDQDKKLRAMMMVHKTVGEGKSKKQVAKEMGISHDTVERTLAWARQANVFVDYEHRLYDELVPLAHEAIKLALMDGDAQVALKVMDSIGLGAARMKQTKAQEDDQVGLYGEIARLRGGSVIDVSPRLTSGDGMEAAESAGAEVDFVPGAVPVGGVHGSEEIAEGEGPRSAEVVDERVEEGEQE